MDRGTWQATVHGVRKSQTQLKRLITYALKLLANAVRQKKKKGIQIGKEVQLLFADSMNICMENPKNLTKNSQNYKVSA